MKKIKILLFLLAGSLSSESVYLTTGDTLHGTIVNHNVFTISLQEESGTVRIVPKSLIKKISYLEKKEKKLAAKIEPVPKVEEPPPPPPTSAIVYEVFQDGRLYTIIVNGEGFTDTLKAKLVIGDKSREQVVRDITPNSFTLVVDPGNLEMGEYDLLIESSYDNYTLKIGKFVVVYPGKESQNAGGQIP